MSHPAPLVKHRHNDRDPSNKMLVKRITYRATYRGGKEADLIFKNFVTQFVHDLSNQDLHDLDQLLQEDDSLIFSWLADIEEVPQPFDTVLLQKLRHYFNTLRGTQN